MFIGSLNPNVKFETTYFTFVCNTYGIVHFVPNKMSQEKWDTNLSKNWVNIKSPNNTDYRRGKNAKLKHR